MKKQNKTKIGVGYVVKAKVWELEKITREGMSRIIRKEVEGFFQDLAGKKKFLVQFKYGKKKKISSSLLVFFKFKIGGWYGWSTISFSWKITRWIVDYCWGYWGWKTLYVWKWYIFFCLLLFVLLNGFIYVYVIGPGVGREIWTWMRRSISEWIKLGKSIGEMLLRNVKIRRIYMTWVGGPR